MLKMYIIEVTFLLLAYRYNMALTFNLSPMPNLILKMPNTTTKLPKLRSSYFGYNIVLRENSILIAAPRAQSTLKSQASINETGVIFKCPLNFNDTTNTEEGQTCFLYPIDSEGNNYAENYLEYELKAHQWLGAAMDGGSKESDPLLVCAPHFAGGYDKFGEENQYFHGICYWSANTMGDKPSEQNIKKIKSLTERNKQWYVIDGTAFFNYQLGEQGFSAHITPNNREVIMGAPGIDQWKGSVIYYNVGNKSTKIPMPFLRSFSYGGYAVSSGYLDSENRDKIIYVATSPHTKSNEFSLGEAILFDFDLNGVSIEKRAILRGTKYGEFFGYAVLVEDINNDDIDDLIVSAPLYATDDTVDVGTIYVFINLGGFLFQSERIESPFQKQARFGTTLSTLGDINRDGYPDIAISAPFEAKHGAVAIYLGGPDGLQKTPCQILNAESELNAIMFGHALSKGVDIDGNGFNDLAVGDPAAEMVYVYRAYPVVDVRASIKSIKPRLELNDTDLEIEFCFKMTTEGKKIERVELRLEIEVDPKIRRLTLRESGGYRFELHINATTAQRCQSFVSLIRYSPMFVFIPMELNLKYSLVHDAQKYGKKEFCTKCAILEPTNRKIARSSVTYRHGCKGKICQVDLHIKAKKMPTEFTFGVPNTLYAEYFIENLGEKAFEAKLEVSTSLNISHAKIPPNCLADIENGNKLTCSLSSTHAFTENTTIEIGFDMSHLSRISEMNITALVYSGGYEVKQEDNSLNSTIQLYSLSSLEIVGQSNETSVSILKKSSNFDAFYTLKLQNNGQSTLYNIGLWILVPAAYKDEKNFTRNFLNPTSSLASVLIKDYHLPAVNFDIKNSVSEIKARTYKSIIQEESHRTQQIMPKNSTITLNYNTTSPQDLASAYIPIMQLEVGQHITIDIVLNIAPKAVKKVLKKRFDYMELFLDLKVEPLMNEHVRLNITKIFSPAILVNVAPPGTPIWVYIISIIGGLTLLTLMALILRKLGFFKRQTKEEMEELINEKIEKERMKAELETEIETEEGA